MSSRELLKSVMKTKHRVFDALFGKSLDRDKLRSMFPCRYCGRDMHETYAEGFDCCKKRMESTNS